MLPLLHDEGELEQKVITGPPPPEPESLPSAVLPLGAFVTRNAGANLLEAGTRKCEPLVHSRFLALGSVPPRRPRHRSVLVRIQVQATDALSAA